MFVAPPAQASRHKVKTKRFDPPVRGLIRNEPITRVKPAGAVVLDNMWPRSTGAQARGGAALYATLTGSTSVGCIMPYIAGSVAKIFATNDVGIYDITTIADPTSAVSAASGIGTVGSGLFSYTQFATSGGEFLICVNGTNKHKTFDGSAWAEDSPAITGTTSDNFSHVWSYKNRLYFVKKNSRKIAYLGADAIGGGATEFPLGGVFRQGGNILFGATWSIDAGDGIDDKCVIVTTEGEVAVYEGADPSSWSLIGVYKMGRPMGKNAHARAGGDILVATNDGLVAMSQVYTKDQQALRQAAVSYQVEELYMEYADRRNSVAWQMAMWPHQTALIMSVPTIAGQDRETLVADTRGGGFARFTGWDMRGLACFRDAFFYGSSDGKIYQLEQEANDAGSAYVCRVGGSFDDWDAPGQSKSARALRATLKTNYPDTEYQMSVSADQVSSFPTAPSAGIEPGGGVNWGSATWGAAASVYGGTSQQVVLTPWQSVEGVGSTMSWQLQFTMNNEILPAIELLATDAMFEVGDAMV